jgi:START domain
MAVGEMDFTIPQIMGYLSKINFMMDYNVPLEFAWIVKKINNWRHLAHVGAKGVAIVVSPRDFVIYSEIANYEPNPNQQTIITFSVDLPDTPVGVKGSVRANMMCGGWHLEKLDETKTKATFVSMSDIKGSIPKFVL